MFDKLEAVESRFCEIESRLADPEIANRPGDFRKLSQEHASLQAIVAEYRNYKKLSADIESNHELMREKDPEIASMAKDELKRQEEQIRAKQYKDNKPKKDDSIGKDW